MTACDAPPAGDVRLTLSSGRVVAAGHVLVCAGRESKANRLGVAAAGVELGITGGWR